MKTVFKKKNVYIVIAAALIVCAIFAAIAGCNKQDGPANAPTDGAAATDGAGNVVPGATDSVSDPTFFPGADPNGPREVHNSANDSYEYLEAVCDVFDDGIYVILTDFNWLSWFGLTEESISAEKADCAAAGTPFLIKVKATPFSTLRLEEDELEDQIRYKACDGTDDEMERHSAHTLTFWVPSEITFGTKTVSAPMGRYKIQPYDGNALSETALADGGYKDLVVESRTEDEVVYHYEYHVLVTSY